MVDKSDILDTATDASGHLLKREALGEETHRHWLWKDFVNNVIRTVLRGNNGIRRYDAARCWLR